MEKLKKLKKFLMQKFSDSVATNLLKDLSDDSRLRYGAIMTWLHKAKPKFVGSFDLILDDLEMENCLQRILDTIQEFYLTNKYSVSKQRFHSELFRSNFAFENQDGVLFISVEELGLVYNVLIVKFK